MTIAPLLVLAFGLGRDCPAAEIDARSEVTKTVRNDVPTKPTAGTYHVRAGGAHNYVALTNAPASNRVAISFGYQRASADPAVFRIANREAHKVLVWNVRVQVKSRAGGTDGQGWDTVYDDYPVGIARYETGQKGELSVSHPGTTPWRVCVLYSIDWTDSGKTFSGNYEVISQERKE
ncbi:MAG: hypothetical protein JNN07_28965 [Verrucomicrobiales bacterium]|nr:hypothetical protein [Verrucomicrobiales bacterium]